jgi:uncharacterized protein YcfJ
MKTPSRLLFAAAALALAGHAAAQVTFYEREDFGGRSLTASGPMSSFGRAGFNDAASSAVVRGERWEVCEHSNYGGRCVLLRRGEYPSLAAMGLNDRLSSARPARGSEPVDEGRYAPAPPPWQNQQITLYDEEGYRGASVTSESAVERLAKRDFDDRRAESVVVRGSRADRWEVCDDRRYRGRCVVLRRGQYPSLAALGLERGIASARAVGPSTRIDESRYAPAPVMGYDYGRRRNERLYQADVLNVRAVVNDQSQRCWLEREQVPQDSRSRANVPGAILGAVVGGILGHQVGGGSGRDAATAVGAVAGAAVGSNVGRDRDPQMATRDVQRCSGTSGPAQVEYYDVTYSFRGTEHRVQMTNPPGATVTGTEQGDPRAG